MEHALIILTRIHRSCISVAIGIKGVLIVEVGRRSHILVTQKRIHRVSHHQRAVVVEVSQLVIVIPVTMFHHIAAQHEIFIMQHAILYAVNRKFDTAHIALSVLAQSDEFVRDVLHQIQTVAVHTEQRAGGAGFGNLAPPLKLRALEARHAQRFASGKIERALAVGVETGQIKLLH